MRPPWGFGIAAADIALTRTIVVTGGWNDEYEAIAAALVAAGAEHHVLTGARHRPQDLPCFDAVLSEVLRREVTAGAGTGRRRRTGPRTNPDSSEWANSNHVRKSNG